MHFWSHTLAHMDQQRRFNSCLSIKTHNVVEFNLLHEMSTSTHLSHLFIDRSEQALSPSITALIHCAPGSHLHLNIK